MKTLLGATSVLGFWGIPYGMIHGWAGWQVMACMWAWLGGGAALALWCAVRKGMADDMNEVPWYDR